MLNVAILHHIIIEVSERSGKAESANSCICTVKDNPIRQPDQQAIRMGEDIH